MVTHEDTDENPCQVAFKKRSHELKLSCSGKIKAFIRRKIRCSKWSPKLCSISSRDGYEPGKSFEKDLEVIGVQLEFQGFHCGT